jgi:hypothetical protein
MVDAICRLVSQMNNDLCAPMVYNLKELFGAKFGADPETASVREGK